MQAANAATLDDGIEERVRLAVRAEVQPLLAELHRFVDRRFAELSAELDSSVQLADMAEERIARELATVHEQVAHLVALPSASTRNSGVELEAVVVATEAAANTILEAAEAIQDWIENGARDQHAIAALADKVNSIFEACSFQDVTGQRIRRAIQHLQQVEAMLGKILPEAATKASAAVPKVVVRTAMATVAGPAQATADLAQDEIDALLNG
jgi:chemotaxis protein CheZ